MLGTLIATIFLLATFFLQPSTMTEIPIPVSPIIPLLLLIFQQTFLLVLIHPLQKAEYQTTPRIFELLKNDSFFKWINTILSSLLLFMLFFNLSSLFAKIPPYWTMSFWVISFGLVFDLFYHLIKQTYLYFDPFTALKFFSSSAAKSLTNNQEEKLSDWMESLSEIALKSIEKGNISLCSLAINESSFIIRSFMQATKKKHAAAKTKVTNTQQITEEETNYLLIFFLDRLESVYNKAFEKKDFSVASQIITLLGKIAIQSAETKPSYATYPIYLLGKFSRQAEDHGINDLSLKGSCTLIELSKAIVENFNPPPSEFKDPFLSVITQLDEIAKSSFKRDKSSNIKILSYPFQDLKNLFQSEKMKSHRDTEIILKELTNVQAEWEALEGVMKMMPPIKKDQSE